MGFVRVFILIFLSTFIIIYPVDSSFAGEPDMVLDSTDDGSALIALYAFPGYSIIEALESSKGRGKSKPGYTVRLAPALDRNARSALQCVNDPMTASPSTQCDVANLPPTEPDFSTCNEDGCVGPGGCHHDCVEVWGFGAFRVVASYGPLGGLTVNVDEMSDENEDEGDESDDQEEGK